MIFSTFTKELNYYLYLLLNIHEQYIINLIISYKNILEHNNNINWYIDIGTKMNKLRNNNDPITLYRPILFNPRNSNYNDYNTIYDKYFKFSILFESLQYDNFIIKKNDNNKYLIPKLSDKIKVLNNILLLGIEELKLRLFLYRTSFLTDRMGNNCFRPIIFFNKNNKINYEYKTIAIIDDKYSDPIERLPSLIN
jgi:hypothetical protein